MIPVYKPYLPKSSLNFAHDALDSTWISSSGKYIQMAQEKLENLIGAHVLLANNGTSACHLVAKSLYQAYPPHKGKKQIIVPNNVFVAAWNAFLFDKDYILIPVDADLDTWNYDLKKLDNAIKNSPTADVLVVHNIGNIINVPNLQRKYPNVNFVEDNCEGFLGKYEGKPAGTAGFASAISFFGNKNITSGEGGAFITTSEESYLYAKCIWGQGQSSKRFVHDELGYNYRMTNIQAAILYGQLEVLPTIVNMKNEIFNNYKKKFQNREDILIQTNLSDTQNPNWMFGVRVPGQTDYETAEIFFKQKNIEIRPMFYTIYDHTHLKNCQDILTVDCTNARILNKECFILPSYPELTLDEQKYIISSVNNYLKFYKR